jgi:hypothetical protein
MNTKVASVDIVGGGMIVNFDDQTSAFFDAEFLYSHRSDSGNSILPDEKAETSLS